MPRCICGADNWERYEHEMYHVGPTGMTGSAAEGRLGLGRCRKCGVIRQLGLPFDDEAGLVRYYSREYPPTKPEYEVKNQETDQRLARLRCRQYGVKAGQSVLDVGSGSGAFVEEARARGAEAWGCEIGRYHYAGPNEEKWTYRQRFEDVHFPTDFFDLVTCHDVLEHVLDPAAFVAELFRVTRQGGQCMLDFPRFFHQAGAHHWKGAEHVWFLDQRRLRRLLQDAGFVIDTVRNPIDSKILFRLSKPEQERTTVLVPPGVGDSYWSVVKMQAFIRERGIGLPDVGVVCPRSKAHDGHKRSFPFLQMFPFIHCSERCVEGRSADLRHIWREAYMRPGRTVFRDVAGFDWFLAYNGHLRVGRTLEEADDLACDWHPPMFESLGQQAYRDRCRRKYYMALYFVFGGTYLHWIRQFPVRKIIEAVNDIADRTGLRPVFLGASWDKADERLSALISKVKGAVNLVGRTTLDQAFGLMKGAEAVVGFPSGLTIMAAAFGCRTMIIWNDYYNRKFALNACPPDVRGVTYWAENTANLTPEYLAGWATEKITGSQYGQPRLPVPDPRPEADVDEVQAAAILAPKSRLEAGVATVPKPPARRVVVACVLKTGGYFDAAYVNNLRRMVARHLKAPHDFVCLTDDHSLNGCETLPLTGKLPGWWSKVELFRPGLFGGGRVLYFDLDTLIVDDIPDMVQLEGEFYGLRPWNKINRAAGNLASGVMAWKDGEFTFLYSDFGPKQIGSVMNDQVYFSQGLRAYGVEYEYLQEHVAGIRSYKRECLHLLPSGTRVVCFHGRPRIHECNVDWVQRAWSSS